MSISDATGSLTTTWTEQSPVAFTAGTLADIDSCKSEVQAKLNRGTLSSSSKPTTTQVGTWLIIAKQELAEVKNFSWKRRYATASTAAGTYRYALPPDYNGGQVRLRDTTNDRDIPLWDSYHFDLKYPNPSTENYDEPLLGCIKDREVWLAPPPASTYTLELEYGRSGDDNTASDFSWLPEIDRFRCCVYAIWQSFLSLHQWDAAEIYHQEWMQALGKAVKADGKRRWKTMLYQALSWQQEYDLRSYQQGSS